MDHAFTTDAKFRDETALLADLAMQADLDEAARQRIARRGADLVRRIRAEAKPSLMEHFLSEYGLSTREGVALMCLAEAMLRVPDRVTIDALIEDKITPSDWGRHLGEATSPLVNASTWALMLTGKVLDDDQGGTLRRMVRRLGEPVIRTAVGRAMKEMGRQFVLGQTIDAALSRARSREAQGFTYSYDMLGEAAMTGADAARYDRAYQDAITAIAHACDKGSVEANPGISIKLSALHPRYEVAQEGRVMRELVPVVLRLARQARAANMGLNIDAEEQDRLVLSLKVIEAVLADPSLAGWDGFGVVVQAYGKRAGATIDALHAMAVRHDRRIMVRLVKGAYWDTEIKRAQVDGHPDFPLFTSKPATDISFIANARKLFDHADRIYPQFATHNAHTVAAILDMANGRRFEFQRLHGMGERLHDITLRDTGGRCRIYAPVGAHRDLLAYLVRRLLENGANSSFVNQIVDEGVPPEEVARDPFATPRQPPAALVAPMDLFGTRRNSMGFDLSEGATLDRIMAARNADPAPAHPRTVRPGTGPAQDILNPATGQPVGQVIMADAATATRAIDDARPWDIPAPDRAAVLRRAANLYEDAFGPIFGLLAREAGKTLPDAVAELREAVDFLRYYADQPVTGPARGIIGAISPWNFPLAIFTGQIAAALMAGNAVIAKPAEATPLVAAFAVDLLHRAGVPQTALQLLPGHGPVVGTALASDPRIGGIVFTGSTATAQTIARTMAAHLAPGTPLIAETGGLNAMIVDSTALAEQAVRDIVNGAFRSAGQRCSALRCLYVQDDIAPHLVDMIKGAMDELRVGDPWRLDTDVGPVIDARARDGIAAYLAANAGRVIHKGTAPQQGTFIAPTLLRVSGIADLEQEVFGPVLHVATFKGGAIDRVVAEINAAGYGLTFGLHTRIDDRVQSVTDAVHVGNIYVNRNQIGAVVGSQPFGGEGLSGTGPKAGGPDYVPRFTKAARPDGAHPAPDSGPANEGAIRSQLATFTPARLEERILPGPTGELNRLTRVTRPPILCLGPAVEAQATEVEALGGQAIRVAGRLAPDALTRLDGFSAAMWWGDDGQGRAYATALAARAGAILPLLTALPDLGHIAHERHLCVDTTAAGGNAALLAS
ncbi:bifunctional proline dehydrogenase/L-glutamate gamma-semialdehyde dehydrogenase PutA [Falsirhodobacter halotolerans]|uniref:bifunctional proline dehydrogenase/L-glutamate gamma-semialdehyde dehydrogenase PutA n=1 Tax=Falsirhodobacter halotolerans TaxID=1146892 RepID=UPI001FD404E4|nr:bifunctional proline dehydrogenase/L-glutamate gamma-semialdehyde dehydrogenase PutA [Falsirhodobacter halotolerans]MCJ8138976.1 bifunctional proline dehydrogenase/L-glutamate gamma-semialdehyde dehydrogenase PutA [Falsirhodobacter halotolerans]